MASALHRPLLRPAILGDFIEYRTLSERRVQRRGSRISRMSCDLHRLGLGQFYPGAGALLQLPAVATFLRELRAPSKRKRSEIMSSIQGMYRRR